MAHANDDTSGKQLDNQTCTIAFLPMMQSKAEKYEHHMSTVTCESDYMIDSNELHCMATECKSKYPDASAQQ